MDKEKRRQREAFKIDEESDEDFLALTDEVRSIVSEAQDRFLGLMIRWTVEDKEQIVAPIKPYIVQVLQMELYDAEKANMKRIGIELEKIQGPNAKMAYGMVSKSLCLNNFVWCLGWSPSRMDAAPWGVICHNWILRRRDRAQCYICATMQSYAEDSTWVSIWEGRMAGSCAISSRTLPSPLEIAEVYIMPHCLQKWPVLHCPSQNDMDW